MSHDLTVQFAQSLADLLSKGAILPEAERARLHALTRKVQMTDEDLEVALTRLLAR